MSKLVERIASTTYFITAEREETKRRKRFTLIDGSLNLIAKIHNKRKREEKKTKRTDKTKEKKTRKRRKRKTNLENQLESFFFEQMKLE